MNLTPEQLRAAGWVELALGKWVKQNPNLGAGGGAPFSGEAVDAGREAEVQASPTRTVKRLRQSSKPLLNKLETEFFNTIKDKHKYYGPVRPQAKTYRLANGVRYTPDFSASLWPSPPGQAPRETAWEVKGKKAWDDSLVKVKVAASSWPEVRWLLVWKQDGQWQEQEVLP